MFILQKHPCVKVNWDAGKECYLHEYYFLMQIVAIPVVEMTYLGDDVLTLPGRAEC